MTPEELLDYLLTEYESEFVEFKGSNSHAENIGELVSALANGAVLAKKDEAYLIFGVNDQGGVVGTSFNPKDNLKGNMPFKNWLSTCLTNCDSLNYLKVDHPDGSVIIIVVPRAKIYPVQFMGVEYIRVGDSKKKLNEHPEIARKLWEEILRVSFEDGNASDLLNDDADLRKRLQVAQLHRGRNAGEDLGGVDKGFARPGRASAWMILARRSRSASACLAMARTMFSVSSTVLISTLLTLIRSDAACVCKFQF